MCVVVGNFIILNLLVAVQSAFLDKAFDEEAELKQGIVDKIEAKKKLKKEIDRAKEENLTSLAKISENNTIIDLVSDGDCDSDNDEEVDESLGSGMRKGDKPMYDMFQRCHDTTKALNGKKYDF